MAGLLPGKSTCHGTSEEESTGSSHPKQEEMSPWFMSRKEIEDHSPSRRDGINLRRETYLRRSYCHFLRDLGQTLKVPQKTIATAILFCHRFFLYNSHSKNDRMIIATVCMFLALKVEETPRPLRDVVLVSYKIAFRKDPEAAKRIKQKVYKQREELILIGEKLVLVALRFDLTVHHPYIPMIQATKKLNMARNGVPRAAWNFVNDGLMTSLSLQFKPRQIAAGAIFLAAKFLKVKLSLENLRQELQVNPRQLEEISNQILDLYEQRRVPLSRGSEVEADSVGAPKMAAVVIESKSNQKQKGEAEDKDQYLQGSIKIDREEVRPELEKKAEISHRNGRKEGRDDTPSRWI